MQVLRTQQNLCRELSPWGLNANFVGNNHEAAVSNLFAKGFWFSKPCFYCSNHSFAKKHSSLAVN